MENQVNATVGGGVSGVDTTVTGNQTGQETTTSTPAGTPTTTNTQAGNEPNGGGAKQPATFTEADLDRRIQQALETAKSKWQTETEERIKQEREDAEKLARMSEKEKAEELARRQKEGFDTERSEFERQRSIFEAQRALADRKLPLSFAEMLAGKDETATNENINVFEKAFSEAVQAAVVDKMKGTPPPIGGGQSTNTDPFLQGLDG